MTHAEIMGMNKEESKLTRDIFEIITAGKATEMTYFSAKLTRFGLIGLNDATPQLKKNVAMTSTITL